MVTLSTVPKKIVTLCKQRLLDLHDYLMCRGFNMFAPSQMVGLVLDDLFNRHDTAWDRACLEKVVRPYGGDGDDCLVEPGVNFFVLALERLGATTLCSCEGHPHGFNVIFRASHELAKRIAQHRGLTVEIFYGWRVDGNVWRLTLDDSARPWFFPGARKRARLRAISKAWEDQLLDYPVDFEEKLRRWEDLVRQCTRSQGEAA